MATQRSCVCVCVCVCVRDVCVCVREHNCDTSVLCSTAACTVAHMRVCPRQCVYVCVCTSTLRHNCITSVLCSTATCTVAHVSVSPCPCVCTRKLWQHCNTSVLCSTASRDTYMTFHDAVGARQCTNRCRRGHLCIRPRSAAVQRKAMNP